MLTYIGQGLATPYDQGTIWEDGFPQQTGRKMDLWEIHCSITVLLVEWD